MLDFPLSDGYLPKEMYIFLGAVIGAVAAYITTKITVRNQVRIAEINAQKDVVLQSDRLLHERVMAEVALERKELRKMHVILSRVSLETSLTMSYIQSDNNMRLHEFRERYMESCHRLHEAKAISDIYYPEMSDSVCKIYGQTNVFWGDQESVLRTDIKDNRDVWECSLSKVIQTGNEISSYSRALQEKISNRGEELKNTLGKRFD
ncbi:hypothetical protein [Kushneria konosiri]|uniref:DUF4760 domain-containing protein n=1 Tax=Kushneria konosiri TaxID=698828 RepID=A0A2Z2H7S6_9GAMM|nr:hypothetical protein [Kushneria konosiri]ARS53513.1 hypothetical protein B9G99_12145 [Kushneria konosiri]